jgi:hypothetical protein
MDFPFRRTPKTGGVMKTQTHLIFSFLAGIVPSWFISGIQPAFADTTVTIEQPVHFTTAERSDVVLDAGSYVVEAAEKWLRLTPRGKRSMPSCWKPTWTTKKNPSRIR